MTIAELSAFCLYAFVTSITPGPNNSMLASSGVNFGFYRTLPHILGVSCGLCLMILAIGLGLERIFQLYPMLFPLVRLTGACYLIYLAWRIANAVAPSGAIRASAAPLGYWGAVVFQWLNPKTWLMAVGSVTVYAPAQHHFRDVALIALVFTLINAPCVSAWAAFGSMLKNRLGQPQRLLVFNRLMAATLVLTLYPLLAR
ncbi:LysE family translocator [Acerihabitans arboris]|uniref:LysE family transporter n=1 Tax=Acerihabitans arboris TaxID=2691583 RepID=A0A845SKI9_9GAMM|nr:LysE family translocator [Acerihabitans arboris]NDL64489.1 LysE family transporter [Acerihabitans arboris]